MKSKLTTTFLIVFTSLFLGGCELNPFAKKAGIQITSHPDANVIVNGKSVGKTPYYVENSKPGATTIQMTAIDSGQTWETQINLLGGTLTTIHREFGETPDKSHSYSLSFEKLSNTKDTSVNIISVPATATISMDGKPQGFTPLSIDTNAGPHVFTFTSTGFQDKVVNAAAQEGYRLNINLTMATMDPVPTPTPTATPSATPTPTKATTNTKTIVTPLPKQASTSAAVATKPYVEILNTPTGWLKVRSEASVNAEELAKVNPGDTFPYKEASASGWFKIEYLTGKTGFVSSQYAKLVK